MAKTSSISNPLTFRYSPNQRFLKGAFKNQEEVILHKDDFGESITDKESYRLQLINGVGASSLSAANPSCYMFPDGKYDIHKDISFILRPDLSPVEIDEYISSMKKSLENYDEDLKQKIEKDIAYAEEIKKRAESDSSSDSDFKD